MAFKIPEERRLTDKSAKSWTYLGKEVMTMITEVGYKEDGYFFIPPVNSKGAAFEKGGKYLCKATLVDGWRVVAVNVPAEGRSPTWEELHWVKKFFFDEDDVTVLFQPGKSTYVGDATYWIHFFFPENADVSHPPFLKFPFRKVNDVTRIWRVIKKKVKTEVAIFFTLIKPKWKAKSTSPKTKESLKKKQNTEGM